MTYSKKLQNPKWQKKRLEILNRDKWKCVKCKDEKTELHVHHLKYEGEPHEVSNDFLVTLCAHCHEQIERFKKMDIYKDAPFESIKIYKSNSWTDKTRVMFGRILDLYSVAIYDSENNFIQGYDFPEYHLKSILKRLK